MLETHTLGSQAESNWNELKGILDTIDVPNTVLWGVETKVHSLVKDTVSLFHQNLHKQIDYQHMFELGEGYSQGDFAFLGNCYTNLLHERRQIKDVLTKMLTKEEQEEIYNKGYMEKSPSIVTEVYAIVDALKQTRQLVAYTRNAVNARERYADMPGKLYLTRSYKESTDVQDTYNTLLKPEKKLGTFRFEPYEIDLETGKDFPKKSIDHSNS
jgi:hypothetical protein